MNFDKRCLTEWHKSFSHCCTYSKILLKVLKKIVRSRFSYTIGKKSLAQLHSIIPGVQEEVLPFEN